MFGSAPALLWQLFIPDEIVKWKKVVTAAGVQAE
jgi:hypothetical protein